MFIGFLLFLFPKRNSLSEKIVFVDSYTINLFFLEKNKWRSFLVIRNDKCCKIL